MSCLSIPRRGSLLFSLVPIFLFLSSTSVSFSFGEHTPQFPTSHKIPTSGAFVERNYGVVVSWRTKRFLAENSSTTTGSSDEEEPPLNSSYLILAAKRTHRKDPLDHFNKYAGGWNISNKHYWTPHLVLGLISQIIKEDTSAFGAGGGQQRHYA